MHAALTYLGTLPHDTVVYNGHEYTASSLKFALSVDPNNLDLARLAKIVSENTVTTGLTTIGDEKSWNPFMRLNSDIIKCANIRTAIAIIFYANVTAGPSRMQTPTLLQASL